MTRLRIAAVGDSHTAGVFASGEEASYPRVLQRLLGRDAFVVNLGYPGAQACQLHLPAKFSLLLQHSLHLISLTCMYYPLRARQVMHAVHCSSPLPRFCEVLLRRTLDKGPSGCWRNTLGTRYIT